MHPALSQLLRPGLTLNVGNLNMQNNINSSPPQADFFRQAAMGNAAMGIAHMASMAATQRSRSPPPPMMMGPRR